MKKLASLSCILALGASNVFALLPPEQAARVQQKLSDSDAKVRASGLEELQEANLQTAGNAILPLLSKALRDTDANVRASAAASLAMISVTTAPKLREPVQNQTDIRSYPPLKKDLIATFNDASEETRKNALAAYAFAFEVTPAIQNDLVVRYESERTNSLFRTAILEALTIDGTPTPAAKSLLIRVAGSPAGSANLAQVILDSKAPPVELLPIFVDQFAGPADNARRALFARAIRKFGPAAKPYIPTLTQAANSESDDVARKTIMDTVVAIQSAK